MPGDEIWFANTASRTTYLSQFAVKSGKVDGLFDFLEAVKPPPPLFGVSGLGVQGILDDAGAYGTTADSVREHLVATWPDAGNEPSPCGSNPDITGSMKPL